jgi:hypothetical protein
MARGFDFVSMASQLTLPPSAHPSREASDQINRHTGEQKTNSNAGAEASGPKALIA